MGFDKKKIKCKKKMKNKIKEILVKCEKFNG